MATSRSLPQLASFSIRAALIGRDRALDGSTQTALAGPRPARPVPAARVSRSCPRRGLRRRRRRSSSARCSRRSARASTSTSTSARAATSASCISSATCCSRPACTFRAARTRTAPTSSQPIRDQPGTLRLVRIGARHLDRQHRRRPGRCRPRHHRRRRRRRHAAAARSRHRRRRAGARRPSGATSRASRAGVKVLFLTHRLPYAPNRGDRIRAFHIIRTLGAARRARRRVAGARSRRSWRRSDRVAGAWRPCRPRSRAARLRNYAHGALQLAGRDAAHAPAARRAGLTAQALRRDRSTSGRRTSCSPTARAWRGSRSSRRSSDFPLVLDLVDVDSEKWAALAEASRLAEALDLSRAKRGISPAFERRAPRRRRDARSSSTNASATRCVPLAPGASHAV